MQVAVAPRDEDIGGAIVGVRAIGLFEISGTPITNVRQTPLFMVFLKRLRAQGHKRSNPRWCRRPTSIGRRVQVLTSSICRDPWRKRA